MTEQKEQIPPQIQDWINTEKERLRPSGLDVRVYELGLKDMYHKIDFSALRSENERLKGELAKSAKLISVIVLDAVKYLHPDDVKKGREIILKHYPKPTT